MATSSFDTMQTLRLKVVAMWTIQIHVERSHLTACFLTIVTSCSDQRSHLRKASVSMEKKKESSFKTDLRMFFLSLVALGGITAYYLLSIDL